MEFLPEKTRMSVNFDAIISVKGDYLDKTKYVQTATLIKTLNMRKECPNMCKMS